MNHLLDIAGSYIVGGIILLAVVGLTLHFSSLSQDVKMAEITHRSLTDLGEIIEHDFNRLGYRVENGNKITSINANAISFLSDIDNNGTIDTISYSEITNQNEKFLRRRVANQTSSEWQMQVSDLLIEGFDSNGASTYTISQIKSVAVTVMLENEKAEDANLAGKIWKRQFFPKNL
ncbi:MAG: hypothetical protein GW789_09125 [Ignavibacteria bacterium]|nr:hypothetical protein [Ignavibacteria bacterium]